MNRRRSVVNVVNVQRAPGTGVSKKARRRARLRLAGMSGPVSGVPGRSQRVRRNALASLGPRPRPQFQQPAMAGGGRRRNRNRGGNTGNMNFRPTSDGLSVSTIVRNDSVIEDTFQRRTEKLINITGTTAATLAQAFAGGLFVNPGNTVMFPIFSQIAATYEEYRCNFLEFRIGSEAYTAVNSTASAGKVIMATNFDPDDGVFTTDQQMENYEGMVKAAPYTSFAHDVVKAHKLRRGKRSSSGRSNDLPLNNYFVFSSGNLSGPTNSTSKFYDIGLFQLATQSNAAAVEIGELYVTYSFTMVRPKQQTPLGQNLLQAHIVESPAASGAVINPLGTGGGVLRAGSTLPVVTTTNSFTLPVVGAFLITAVFNGSVGAVTVYGTGANIVGLTTTIDNTVSHLSTFSSGASTSYFLMNVLAAGTGAANTVTISGMLGYTAGSADVLITQISTALLLGKSRQLSDEKSAVEDLRVHFEKKFAKLSLLLDKAGIDSDEPEIVPPLARASPSIPRTGFFG